MIRQVTGIMALILCCSPSLSWETVDKDHVESIDMIQYGDERLEVYIESIRGIGSVTLDFGEPVQVDSITVTLMYDSLSPYRFCESFVFEFTGEGDSNLWMVDHSMIDLGADGTAGFPVDDQFVTLRVGWIDFYRL